MRQLAAWLLVLFFARSALSADAKSRFVIKNLAVQGEVLEVVPADLDGDGKQDLLVAFKRGLPPDEQRFFAVFWNRGDGFSAKPDLEVPVDVDACIFDTADLDGQPGEEVLWVTPTGLAMRSLRGRVWGPPIVLTHERTLYHQPGRGELDRVHLVQDIAGDASRDVVVPGLSELLVYKHSGAELTLAAHLEVPTEGVTRIRGYGAHSQGIPAMGVENRVPAVHVADADGDGLRDIVASLEDRIAIFRQQPGMGFAAKPTFERNFAIRTPDERREARAVASITVSDIDGDGVADLVVRKDVSHGLASALATTFVFFGKKGGGYAEKPDQVIKSEGASGTEVEMIDLTGDGHPDLVVPSVNIGVWQIIRVLTTKTVAVNFQVFPFVPANRKFADKPTAQRELKFNVSLSGQTEWQALDETGDYNGDKRPDLVFGTGEHELSIFPGIVGPGLFAADAVETLDVRSFGQVLPVDLNEQGKSDLVLHYSVAKDHRGEIVVMLNRGPW
jgi:hypothetical protein